MSLRARLTLLYSSLLGGILLLFGMGVYGLVSFTLVRQIDRLLTETVNDILQVTRIDSLGEINLITFPPLDLTANVYVQVWDQHGELRSTSPGMGQYNQPLTSEGMGAALPAFHNVYFQNAHLRVLKVPLVVGKRPIGNLQVASSLRVVDSTRQDLLSILLVAVIGSIGLAGIGSWLAIGRELASLSAVTHTALQITHADDLSFRIPYSGSPDDEVGGLIHAFNQTLERLEVLFTSQQRFLADVSHELRTPLTVIKGSVDLMRRMKTIDEENLASIDHESNRLNRMVGDLLLLAQSESGKLPLNKVIVELDTLLLEVFHEMSVLAHSRLELKVTEIDQIQVVGDRDRLKQVLLNLVSNAIQYTPAGGEVFLSLCKIGDQARLIVRDTGPGIPTKDLPHIFKRFYRVEKSRTRSNTSGFGLGLSIAYWIVDHHGGRIEVDSQEGKGTTFCIWLPLLNPSNHLPINNNK
jgi:signal transduction histidine kinase